MRLFLPLICISAATEAAFQEDGSMALIQLRKRHSELAAPAEKEVLRMDVLIGNSDANSKCVTSVVPVTCPLDAGNHGIRVNDHDAHDRFEITTDGTQVCARRIDSDNGWGMALEIACEGDYRAVLIGNSDSNSKCVTAPVPVNCAADAGNIQYRLNDHEAGDEFEITTNGDQVCARRTDTDSFWGMQLSIACTDVPAPPEPAGPPGPGWYASAAFQDCNAACAGVGLICSEDQLMAHNDEVDEAAEVGALITQVGGVAPASACRAYQEHYSGVPAWRENSDWCAYSNPNRPLNSFDCSRAAAPEDEGKRRLCFCHEEPVVVPPGAVVVDPDNEDEADAVGDPHLTLYSGEKEELCCDGGDCKPCAA